MRISNISKLITVGVLVLSATSIVTNLIALDSFNQRKEAFDFRLDSFEIGTKFIKADDYLTDLVRAFAATGDEKYAQAYDFELNTTQTLEKSVADLEKMGLEPKEIMLIKKAKEVSDILVTLENQAFSAARDGDSKTAINIVYGPKYVENKDAITDMIRDSRDLITARFAKHTEELSVRADVTSKMALATLILNMIAILAAVIFFYQRKVVSPLIELTDNTQKFLEGNRHVTFGYENDNSEIGNLARTLEGYRLASNEAEYQQTVKQSFANIDNALLGVKTYEDFGDVLSSKIARMLEFIYCALYIADEKNFFNREGGYGCDSNHGTQFKFGEGLIGQVAKDRQPIFVSIPSSEQFVGAVTSGAGIFAMRNMLILPIILNDKVLGVFEVGSSKVISHQKIEFLNNLMSTIATKIQILSGVVATVALLQETLEQSERMAEQAARLEEQSVEMEMQQRELKDTEAWFRGIIESAPDAMLIVNKKGEIILCNPKAEEIFGYESGELRLKMVDELVPSEIRASHPAMRANFMATGGPYPMGGNALDVRGIRKDGSSFPIDLGLSLLPNLSGRGVCACAAIRDVTIAKQAADEIREVNAKVKAMHQQTRSSIEYSSIIQRSILPAKDKFPSAFPESFAHWQPKDIVGGDIWFFEPTRREGEFLLFVIDCTGHGVPGAFVTMLVKSIQRSIMMECRVTKKEVHPGELLSIFNKEIKSLLDQHVRESESNAGFDGGIVYFDLNRRGIIRYAGAETPLFLLDKEGKCKTIKGSRHSVGYRSCDENYVYEEHEFSIDAFDRLYLTTDGLLDQNGGAKDIPFGKRKLVSILESNHDKPINEIKELVMNDLAEWKGNAEQNDDITFVGIKFGEAQCSTFQLNYLHNEHYMNERRKNVDRRQAAVDVDAVKEFVKKDGIVFLTYGGFLSQTLITGFADAIEKEAMENNVGMGDSSNILTIFIELAQNILNYSKTTEVGSEETKAEGMIIVGKSEFESGQQQYYIMSQNVVALSDKEKMLPKFEEINTLDKEGLKKRYRELRKSGRDTHEKGGGIGFYEIAKRSDKIEYEFTKLNEDKFYFQFKAFVNIKPTTTTE
jgi:PAS domain S-box-containing protein